MCSRKYEENVKVMHAQDLKAKIDYYHECNAMRKSVQVCNKLGVLFTESCTGCSANFVFSNNTRNVCAIYSIDEVLV